VFFSFAFISLRRRKRARVLRGVRVSKISPLFENCPRVFFFRLDDEECGRIFIYFVLAGRRRSPPPSSSSFLLPPSSLRFCSLLCPAFSERNALQTIKNVVKSARAKQKQKEPRDDDDDTERSNLKKKQHH